MLGRHERRLGARPTRRGVDVRKLDNQTLWERVYLRLKQEILDGHIAPGTVLQEVPLAASLGVSRGPVREALGRLASEGLVTVTPRRGAVVTALTKRDFLEAYQVREALEALGVRLAVPRLTPAGFMRLERLIAAMDACATAGDVTGFFDANSAFHEAFVAAGGNAKLTEMYRLLIGQMGPYRHPSVLLRGSLAVSTAEHRAMIESAREGATERTVELVLHHIRMPQRRLEQLTDAEFLAEVRAGGAASVPAPAAAVAPGDPG
jgi:DNA-binding GntR family transcriptional regulator